MYLETGMRTVICAKTVARDPNGRVELCKIMHHALLQLGAAPLHFPASEVLVPVVHRFELAAINGNARFREQALT
jgi:hypothetical protein